MKHIRWIAPLILVLLIKILILSDLETKLNSPSDGILRSPHSLSVFPLAIFDSLKISYLSTQKGVTRIIPNAEWILTISPPIVISVLYLLMSLFFYLLIRLRQMEKAYIYLSYTIALYSTLFLDFIAGHRFVPVFYFLNFFIIIPFLAFFRSLLGLKINHALSVLLTLLALFLTFVNYPHNAVEEKQFLFYVGLAHGIFFLYCLFIYFRSIASPVPNLRKPLLFHILAAILLLTTASPPLIFIIVTFSTTIMSINNNVLLFLPAIFAMAFFVVSTRFGLVLFDVPVSGTFFRFSYFLFFSLLYWFTIGYHMIQIPYSEVKIRHLFLISLFLFLLDPARTIFYAYFRKYFLLRRGILEKYLKEAAITINNPKQITPFLDQVIQTLGTALQVDWVKMYFSEEIFSDWQPSNKNVHLLPAEHSIWLQIRRWQKAQKYPFFTVTTVGPIRDLLQSQGGFLLAAMQQFPMCIVISGKSGGDPILSEDVRFMRSVLRHTEPLLQNYRLLLTKIQLKKREKELELAARIQRKIIPTHRIYDGLEFVSHFSATEKVTGDYIDMIQPEEGRFRIFLGDVSGHGLGSAYLMSVVRAYLRGSSLILNSPLHEIIEGLNSFLTNSYRGSDFMTLFAAELIKHEDGYFLKYVNAGQHPGLIVYPDTGQAIEVGNSQRVLGVTETQYSAATLDIRRPFRFYLFSDGAFEIFIEKGKILGEKTLQMWIAETVNLSPEKQIPEIVKRVQASIVDPTESDDISILCLSLDPEKFFARTKP